MATFSLEWVNGGEPFEVSPDRLTLADLEAANLAKKQVIESVNGAQVPDAAEDLWRAQLVERMDLAETKVLLRRVLIRVDSKVEDLSVDEVATRLDAATLGRLGEALQEAAEEAEPDASGGGVDPSG